MRVDEKEVEKIANLAKITLTDKEKKKYSLQLSEILKYVEQLNEIDTENVQPLSHVQEVTNIFRQDKVIPSLKKEEVFKNVPEVHGPYYQVPKVITDEPNMNMDK
jgi:aspartyl-tRNA(Asn)/glutamyl-tRNA(Gln) amidotransferase subunit C